MNMTHAIKTNQSTAVINTRTKRSTSEKLRRLDFGAALALIALTTFAFSNPARNQTATQPPSNQAENPVALVISK